MRHYFIISMQAYFIFNSVHYCLAAQKFVPKAMYQEQSGRVRIFFRVFQLTPESGFPCHVIVSDDQHSSRPSADRTSGFWILIFFFIWTKFLPTIVWYPTWFRGCGRPTNSFKARSFARLDYFLMVNRLRFTTCSQRSTIVRRSCK